MSVFRSHASRFAFLPAAAIVVVTMTACTDGDSATPASSSTTVSPTLSTATVDTVSPLDALLGEEPLSNAENLTVTRQREAAIASCMAERGWTYTPETPYDPTVDHGQEFGTSAYGLVHGYGVVQEFEIGRAGVTPPPSANAGYVDDLSDQERQQFNEDLYGSYGPDGQPTEPLGCTVVGADDVSGVAPTRLVDGLADRYTAAVAAVNDDPDLVDARRAWYACVTAEIGPVEIGGRAVTAPEDMDDYVRSLLEIAGGAEVVSAADGNTAGNDLEGDTLTDGSFWGARGGGDPDAEAVDELRAREVELWSLDSVCRHEAGVDEARTAAERHQVEQLMAEFPKLADLGSEPG